MTVKELLAQLAMAPLDAKVFLETCCDFEDEPIIKIDDVELSACCRCYLVPTTEIINYSGRSIYCADCRKQTMMVKTKQVRLTSTKEA